MKRAILLILTITAAFFFAACNGADTANNKPANAVNMNANAAKTAAAAAAPTKEALMAMETKAFDAWKNKDSKFWEGFLADNYVGIGEDGKRVDRTGVIKMMSEDKCEITKYEFSDGQMTPAGADAAIITYKVAYEGKCGGKPVPPAMWSASVYTRSGDTWKGAYHNEIPMMDPNTKPPAPEKAAAPAAKTAPASDEKPVTDTDPMVAAVRKGWEAWKNQDAKALGDVITKDFVLIDPMGQRLDNAGAIKSWTESKCEIKSFSFDDAKGTSMTKDMGIVTLKGIADGTCGGQPAGSLFGSYIMVKDGDAWKAAMIFETPAK
jgi:ketosteroid isomerase-like protein